MATAADNPYLAARQEWNERYGDFIAAAKLWRMAAFISLAISLVLAGGSIYLANRQVVVPYVVELDQAGNPARVFPARKELSAQQKARVIRAQLAQFIRDVREVVSDAELQKRAIKRAYSHLSRQHPAFQAIKQFHDDNSPFRADETVTVEIAHILQLSADSWRIEWLEIPRTSKGRERPQTRMVAIAKVRIGGKVQDKTLLLNPLGVYVLELNWSRDLIGEANG